MLSRQREEVALTKIIDFPEQNSSKQDSMQSTLHSNMSLKDFDDSESTDVDLDPLLVQKQLKSTSEEGVYNSPKGLFGLVCEREKEQALGDSYDNVSTDRDSHDDMHNTQIMEESRSDSISESNLGPSLDMRSNKNTSLMSILSGKQSSRKSKAKSQNNRDSRQIVNDSTSEDSNFTDNVDDSFTESRSNDLRREYDLIELEKKIYKDNAKCVSAKDFLTSLKAREKEKQLEKEGCELERNKTSDIEANVNFKKNPTEDDLPGNTSTTSQILEDGRQDNISEAPILIASDDENDTSVLESKIYGKNVKRTSAKDLFKSFKQKPQFESTKISKTSKKERQTYQVTLKVNSEALAEIKKYESPFRTRGNFGVIISNSSKYEVNDNNTEKTDNFFTKNTEKLTTKSLFKSMMDSSKGSYKLTPLQKLKELDPPNLTREQFHVAPNDEFTYCNDSFSRFPIRTRKYPDLDYIVSSSDKSVLYIPKEQVNKSIYNIQPSSKNINELIDERVPGLDKHPQLLGIYDRFIAHSETNNDSLLWTNLFQPSSMAEVLISTKNQNYIKNWVTNSFKRLKSQSLKNPRNILIKQRKQKQNVFNDLSGFIVTDKDEYNPGSDTEEEIFVPLLIIQGSTGSCKSSSVYAAMNEIDGYIYEINSGQSRGKKDIFNNLKEFSTTQLVHKQNELKKFQKGLLLFEDINILFEQDKNFWLMIQDILNISRRPIVLTCNDLLNIPKNIIEMANEENSIINLDDNKIKQPMIQNYLWLCCLSQGYDVDDVILNNILNSSFNGENYDLRNCLMNCQLLCQNYSSANLINISYNKISNSETKERDTFEELVSKIIELSNSNIISTNSNSLIKQDILENELVDIYHIDGSTNLKQRTLPYELNIGNYIESSINTVKTFPDSIFTFNQLRNIVTTFIGSRSKKLPKFIQDLQHQQRHTRSTRSSSSFHLVNNWTPEPTGISDTSFINYLSPIPFTTELLAFSRDWLGFQLSLNRVEREALERSGTSVKKFLGYRDFQYESPELFETFNYFELSNILNSIV